MMDVEQEQAAASGTANIDHGAVALTAEASRLFRVYKTISAMLFKRGYMVSREMKEMTPTGFTQRFGEYPSREGLTILVVSCTASIDGIIIVQNVVRLLLAVHHKN